MAITDDKVYQYLDGINDSLFNKNTPTDVQVTKNDLSLDATVIPNSNEVFGSGTQSSFQEKVEDVKTVTQDVSYEDIKVVKVRKYRLYKKG